MSRQALATKHPIFSGSNSGAGGGGGATHYHPFKFIDASTAGPPVVVKSKIASQSDLINVVWPLSTLTITGTGGAGSYLDAITLTGACNIWLKVTVLYATCTAAEITKTDPSDGELIQFDTATPPSQIAFYTLLATVSAGTAPNEPGYDFMISTTAYHLTQVAFNHLRTEIRVISGRVVVIAVPV